MKRLPLALVGLRAACGPALILAEQAGAAGVTLAALVSVAFLSDVFDGILARRLGVATEALRRADTVVDTAFYVSAALALLRRAPAVLENNWLCTSMLLTRWHHDVPSVWHAIGIRQAAEGRCGGGRILQ